MKNDTIQEAVARAVYPDANDPHVCFLFGERIVYSARDGREQALSLVVLVRRHLADLLAERERAAYEAGCRNGTESERSFYVDLED